MNSSAPIQGIDKVEVLKSSKKIRDAWNNYFWEYHYCQKQINFGVEERTNYMGDLLNYFDDIVELLNEIPVKPNYQLALFDTVAVLQLMYIQQDLIDELRYIFKMVDSSGDDKTLIRRLRNEIIGHPISRDKKNRFISSVFFTRHSCGENIEYLRYHRDNDYKSKTIHHKWPDLIKSHEGYLLKNLNEIIEKIKKHLSNYKGQLEGFSKSFSSIPYVGLVSKTEHLLNTFYTNSSLYSTPNLLYFYQNQSVHPRYKYIVEQFIDELKEFLVEVINGIDQYKSDYSPVDHLQCAELPMVEIVQPGKIQDSQDRLIQYEFSKLYENHPVFGLNYFMATYQNDSEIFSELLNMNQDVNNKKEYYCSYEYLRYLFKKRGLL